MKTKAGAVLLAFFFTGDWGAHWFYLGEEDRGWFYVLGWVAFWLCFFTGPLIRLFSLVAVLLVLVLLGSRIWDVFYLATMHEVEFESRFNHRDVTTQKVRLVMEDWQK